MLSQSEIVVLILQPWNQKSEREINMKPSLSSQQKYQAVIC